MLFTSRPRRPLKNDVLAADFGEVTPVVVAWFRLTHSRGWLRHCDCWICADSRRTSAPRARAAVPAQRAAASHQAA